MEQNHIFVMNMNNIEKALKDSIVKKKSNFYSNICKDYNQVPLNIVVDYMFKVIDAHVDGMGDLARIKMSLFDVFGGKELTMVDKIVTLAILSSQYELFLKKIYYLIHEETDEKRHTTLLNAFRLFPSLIKLKNSSKQEHRLLFSELKMLRQIRNETCHAAYAKPRLNEMQLDSAIDIVTDMYIFITAAEIINLKI